MGRPSKSITPTSVHISTIKAQRKNQNCVFCFPMDVQGLLCLSLGQLGFLTPDLLSSPPPTLPSLAPEMHQCFPPCPPIDDSLKEDLVGNAAGEARLLNLF